MTTLDSEILQQPMDVYETVSYAELEGVVGSELFEQVTAGGRRVEMGGVGDSLWRIPALLGNLGSHRAGVTLQVQLETPEPEDERSTVVFARVLPRDD